MTALAANKHVLFIEPDYQGEIVMADAGSFANFDVLQIPPYSLDGSGVTLAVIDTGLDVSHPDISGSVSTTRRCFCSPLGCCSSPADVVDAVGHGTQVAGTIVANNGAAQGATILPIKITTSTGIAFISDFLTALDAIDAFPGWGVDVVNASVAWREGGLTGEYFLGECSNEKAWSAVASRVASLQSKGIAVVAGAGNDCTYDREGAPACLANVLSATAHLDVAGSANSSCSSSQTTDEIVEYASHNANTDIVAAGSFITTSTAGGGYGTFEGTSFASPITAACVSVLREDKPAATVNEIFDAIRGGTFSRIPSHTPAQNSQLYPQLDCLAALEWLRNDRADVEAIVDHVVVDDEVILSIRVNGERSSTDLHVNWGAGSISAYSEGGMIGSLNSDCSIDPYTLGAWTSGSCVFDEVLLGQEIEIARFDVSSLVPDPYNDVSYTVDVVSSTRNDHVSSNNSDSVSFAGGQTS
ncbi:S8/S53 family peptidase [Wenzhouxiangella sp. XN79A]|uniref:S8 family peptidase n=1 Tax=Wenzhouxiangella sp. XN79A TaxID=2724193 RepID=UPI00144AD1A2|nr:S8/S53 family peptidase [Wenzhouxiangella sp. XN79A]NKI35361.1 S8/S53 family peptidase [Wenzhouxiangella sp. XN79A]